MKTEKEVLFRLYNLEHKDGMYVTHKLSPVLQSEIKALK